MMPKDVKRLSGYIMLYSIGIDHVYEFGPTQPKLIVI